METTELIAGAIESFAARIEVLSVKSGDVVVLMTDMTLSLEKSERIRAMWVSVLPEGVKPMVLDSGVKLAVLQKA